jgi:peptide/nickel transport system substrate-binding protein
MPRDPQHATRAGRPSALPDALGPALSRRGLIGGLAALGAAAALPSSGGATTAASASRAVRRQSDATTLTIAADGSPSDLDPHSSNDYRSVLAILGMYETLIALKGEKTDEYVGLIAETWESNADKSVWTFHLRDGVTFQDGSPCDAEAVRASFERYMTTGLGTGADWTRFVADPSHITTPDPRTVVFNLGRPQPIFEAVIAGTYGVYVVNTKGLKSHEKDGDWGHEWAQSNAAGMGTGPYQLNTFDPAQHLTMEKNDAYWGGWDGNHFEQVVIRVVPENGTRRQLLERGEVDLVDVLTYDDLEALKKNPDVVIHAGYTARVDYLYLTVAEPLTAPAARQAMCYAFPYDEVVNGVFKAYAKRAKGPVAESIRGFDPKTFTYTTDLDKAKALFAEAGVAPGTTIHMAMESGDENVKALAQLFQANLDKVGMKLDITQVETSSYVGTLYGDAPAEERPNVMPWAWWPSYNDGWSHLEALVSCDAQGSKGGNSGMYCNQHVQDVLDQCKDAPDDATYNTLMAELQQVISHDDPPAIYYAQLQSTIIARIEITGLALNPINVGTYYFYLMGRGQ